MVTQEQKQSLVDSLISEWEHMKSSFTREDLVSEGTDYDFSGIDVRLQLLNDELQLHTGDAQYDTSHQGYWGEATLDYDWDEDELEANITELVDDLLEQTSNWIEIYRISERIIDQRIDDMIDSKSLSKAG